MSKGKGKASRLGGELLASVEAHVATQIRTELATSGLTIIRMESMASGIGKRIAENLRHTWGGQLVYFPVDRSRRDAQVYEEFTGDNHAELARTYHVCVQTIYKIVKAERERRRFKQLTLL